MIIEINKNTSVVEVEQKIANLKPQKTMDTTKYLGKIKWDSDAVDFQNQQRNEWK
jgi:hypothetical protein